jgi:hypothetical protein
VLGYGSGGTVVFAGELGGRPVAVKRMLRQFYGLARREIGALILADEHPNIVRCVWLGCRIAGRGGEVGWVGAAGGWFWRLNCFPTAVSGIACFLHGEAAARQPNRSPAHISRHQADDSQYLQASLTLTHTHLTTGASPWRRTLSLCTWRWSGVAAR